MASEHGGQVNMHASCVAVAGKGLLIIGPSGCGKSALALQLMALGAALVADDRTEISWIDGQLLAQSPAAIAGRIEARGLGILRAPALPQARLFLVVDLGRTETDRMPPHRQIEILGLPLDLVFDAGNAQFASAIWCWLAQDGRE